MSFNDHRPTALAAGLFLALISGASAQDAALSKTIALISNDAAWGDVLLKTTPCSLPEENSCSNLNASASPQKTKTAALTPLQSFSGHSSSSASPNGNNPDEIASAIAPALDKLAKKKALGASPSEKIMATVESQTTPAIHGGNGTFTTLPAGVSRMNQAAKQTLHSLSKQDGQ